MLDQLNKIKFKNGEIKKITSLFILCFTHVALADAYQTIIFNMNNKYDVMATYQVCTYGVQNQRMCEQAKTTLIKAKKFPEDKNYVIIKQSDQDPNIQSAYLEIISAIENDNSGNVVARGKYFDASKHLLSNCGGNLILPNRSYDHDHVGDTELLLNDMHGSPYITCAETFFVADDSN